MDFETISKILLGIISLLAAGTIIKLKFINKNNSINTNQSNNIVHGDQAGRDINKG